MNFKFQSKCYRTPTLRTSLIPRRSGKLYYPSIFIHRITESANLVTGSARTFHGTEKRDRAKGGQKSFDIVARDNPGVRLSGMSKTRRVSMASRCSNPAERVHEQMRRENAAACVPSGDNAKDWLSWIVMADCSEQATRQRELRPARRTRRRRCARTRCLNDVLFHLGTEFRVTSPRLITTTFILGLVTVTLFVLVYGSAPASRRCDTAFWRCLRKCWRLGMEIAGLGVSWMLVEMERWLLSYVLDMLGWRAGNCW